MIMFQLTKENEKHLLGLLKWWKYCCLALPAIFPCHCMSSSNCNSFGTSTALFVPGHCALCAVITQARMVVDTLLELNMRGRHFHKTKCWYFPFYKKAHCGVRDILNAKQTGRIGYGWLSDVIFRVGSEWEAGTPGYNKSKQCLG